MAVNDPQAEAPDELDAIVADSPENDAAINALALTDPEAAYKLRIAKLEGQVGKLVTRQRRSDLAGFVDKVVTEEFPLAPKEAVVGNSKAEIRKNAERAHNGTLAVLRSLGFTQEQIAAQVAGRAAAPAPGSDAAAAAAAAAARPADARAAQWGSPPPQASDTVAGGEQLQDWDDIKRDSLSGKMPRQAVLAEMRKNGPRAIQQPTLAIAARRASGQQQAS